jgi:prophage DNA circulation protein
MSWDDRLLPGSLNGIPFKVSSHEFSGGRHSKKHEPPDRNSGFSEDIGKKTNTFKIEAHVLGDNYFFNRDALISIMEDRSQAILIHPYLGVKVVQPEGFTNRETTSEGRIARISLEFSEKGSVGFPFEVIDKIVDFATAVVSAVLVVQTAFELAFTVAGLPAFTIDSAEAMVRDFCSTVREGLNNVRLSDEQHASVEKKCIDLDINAPVLVRGDPADLFGDIDEIISDLKDLVPDPPDSSTVDSTSGRDDKLAVFTPLVVFRGLADDIPETTPTRIQERKNADALADIIQQLALMRLAEQIVDKQFKSLEEAEETRSIVSDNIEIQLLTDRIDDEAFQSLEDINAKLIAAVPNTNSEFSNVKTVTLLDTTPTLVLAYNLYQGIDSDSILVNEKDIIDRNKIRKPAFAVGDLSVLTGTGTGI